MRYSISKFRDFFEIFRHFSIFEDIYEDATLIFLSENLQKCPPIFKVRNLQKYHSDF